MSEREKLIKEIKKFQIDIGTHCYGNQLRKEIRECVNVDLYDLVTFILNDRKKVVKPLTEITLEQAKSLNWPIYLANAIEKTIKNAGLTP